VGSGDGVGNAELWDFTWIRDEYGVETGIRSVGF
jgi:hypothetical protein